MSAFYRTFSPFRTWSTSGWRPALAGFVALLGLASVAFLLVAASDAPPEPQAVAAPERANPRPIVGVLGVSLHGGPGRPSRSSLEGSPVLRHRGLWVNGPYYQGHSDNDLRGFLDGRFRYGWNQANQIHVRIGRLSPPARPEMGERELFRNLHRWEGVFLPEGSTIVAARLEIDLEVGSDRELDLLLYQVRKDWNPGHGGVEHNNNSAPAVGEVWWNERRQDMDAWGLPGAGFASDTHPEADTPKGALARAVYAPGDSTLSFESMALQAYIQERVSDGQPLLFLLKLSDYLEDVEGTLIVPYSSNYGDSRNTAGRPRLRLDWVDLSAPAALERSIILEHGRSMVLPRIPSEGFTAVSTSFIPEEGFAAPRLMIRGGRGDVVSDWIDAALPVTWDWDWVEVRLDAVINPTPIGTPFRAQLRETWITTGPPDSQIVPWVFVSPSGEVHEVQARYLEDYTWEVDFIPDEVGRWVYQSRQQFLEEPHASALGAFDVIVDDHVSGFAALGRLNKRIDASELRTGHERVRAFGESFNRLQRAIIQLATPETFPLAPGTGATNDAGGLLDATREALSGTYPSGPRLPLHGGEETLLPRRE